MSRGIRHPFSRLLYEPVEENVVRVTDANGSTGLFDRNGRWISGDVYSADPELCIWLGSRQAAVSHRLSKQS